AILRNWSLSRNVVDRTMILSGPDTPESFRAADKVLRWFERKCFRPHFDSAMYSGLCNGNDRRRNDCAIWSYVKRGYHLEGLITHELVPLFFLSLLLLFSFSPRISVRLSTSLLLPTPRVL